jgi:hypothetical protein
MIKKYIEYLHLKKEVVDNVTISDYAKANGIDLANKHLQYLKEIYDFQRERQGNIENKNSQLVGQASVIISIIALFIPLLIDKFSNIGTFPFIIIIIGFIFILFHYLVAIIHSIKTLQINHYPYCTRSTNTVTKLTRATNEEDFIKEEIEDLIWSIGKNTIQNNRKGRNLIFATRSFRIATIGLCAFTLLILSLSTIIKPDSQKIEIDSISETIIKDLNKPIIEQFDKLNNRKEIEQLNQSLIEIKKGIDSLKTK